MCLHCGEKACTSAHASTHTCMHTDPPHTQARKACTQEKHQHIFPTSTVYIPFFVSLYLPPFCLLLPSLSLSLSLSTLDSTESATVTKWRTFWEAVNRTEDHQDSGERKNQKK